MTVILQQNACKLCPNVAKSVLTHLGQVNFFCHNSMDQSISTSRVSVLLLLLLFRCFIEILVFNANSVDPGQISASHLGLHYFACYPFEGLRERKTAHYKTVDSGISKN